MEKMTIMKNYDCPAEEGLSYVAIQSRKVKRKFDRMMVVAQIMTAALMAGFLMACGALLPIIF